MSATGRSDARRESDHYVTPPWAIERLLEVYTIPTGATVLDPCAANGELLGTLRRLRPDLTLMGIEIREECRASLQEITAGNVAIGDFFTLAKAVGDGEVDYVLTNPPYSLAQAFINECNRLACVGNIQLLRLNFLGAQKRRDWTHEQRPGARVLPNRSSFTGWGGDATEYAWLIYKDATERGTWDVLSLTPDDEIEAWNAEARKRFPEANPKLRRSAKEEAAAAPLVHAA